MDDCEGVWTQIDRHALHIDIREVITSGDACIDEVDITLNLRPNGTIAFAIHYSETYFPTATLTRED